MSETITSRCLTLKEAQTFLGVKETKLAELIRDGQIATFTIGRRRLVRDNVLQAFIDRLSERVGA